ncbi:DAK2 domain-containing protein [Massiliimalia massiliensis]|uniref:DAK2 domain-containing protein n=1 Tax=Massiliimalia massiliensis TaxID=1852384 RepID=UPI000984A809|nr:DAK2 domain-containing protein [Massiliimalia massiliensis]
MISGKLLSQAIISGANHICNQKNAVDELNVFPVPDGDTGTNMSMTISAGKRALEQLEDDHAGKVAETCAAALLRGARGNSGVILSLLFRGFAKGLKGKEEASAYDLAEALSIGVENAYKAVMNPTEGTILTVARMASEKAMQEANQVNDPVLVFEAITKAAQEALDQTPEMLPVLKKAGVVDAGGKGLVVIFEGMLSVLKDGRMIDEDAPKRAQVKVESPVAEYEGEITFTYCTEFIVDKKKNAKDALKLRAYLETIGDCVVVVDDDAIIKVHVHTDHPGKALEEGLTFGALVNMKIENMREQHAQKQKEVERTKQNHEYVPVDPDMEYGFVAVAAGEGLHALFGDLGVNCVVSGGQTMNPSTEDILGAVQSVPAKTVFVLPNNKNIIMAAEQAVKLADRRVCVLQTRTIPQGLSAMLAFDPEASFEDNRVNMTKALDHVQSGQITFAARDSDYDGHDIKKGEILAMDNGKLSFVEKDVTKALLKLLRSLAKKADGNFMTVVYGIDVTDEQAEEAKALLESKFSDFEVNFISGGQPVYYYIVSVE